MAYRIGDLAAGTPATSAEFEFSITGSGGSRKVTLANLLSSPGPIGNVTPNTGAFTTLSAGGTDAVNTALIKGVTKGIRFGNSATESTIQGIDNTGVGSYQPLSIYGSTLTLQDATGAGIALFSPTGIAFTGAATFSSTVSATGQVTVANGTAAAPAIAFTSAATIGFWKRAAGVTNWANGSGGLQFSSNAAVGAISSMTNDSLTTAWSIIDGTTTSFSTAGGRNISIVPAGGSVILGTATGTVDIGVAATALKRLYVDYTNTATVGAVTINKAAGRVNIAAAGTSVVVTNTLVTAASHVLAVMSSADATGRVTSVVPGVGSFTINTVAVTAQASFDFFVINAD